MCPQGLHPLCSVDGQLNCIQRMWISLTIHLISFMEHGAETGWRRERKIGLHPLAKPSIIWFLIHKGHYIFPHIICFCQSDITLLTLELDYLSTDGWQLTTSQCKVENKYWILTSLQSRWQLGETRSNVIWLSTTVGVWNKAKEFSL